MTTKPKPKKPETIKDLIALTDKENPKREDLDRMRKILDEDSSLVRVNETSRRALDAVIESHTTSALMKELYQRQIKEKRESFNYESENVMVQMLINQVILCNIRLNVYEMFHAKKLGENNSIASGLYWDRLLSTYQRRFQRACESLAKVKKLLSEADLRHEQAKTKKSQSTLNSQKLYKMLSD